MEDPAASISLPAFHESQPVAAVKALEEQRKLIAIDGRRRIRLWAVKSADWLMVGKVLG